MITPQQLSDAYALNLRVVEMQLNGLSHADTLILTPYNINTLNWVLGHMAVYRDIVLDLLGETPELTPEETERYKRESEPITADGADVMPLERILKALRGGQERISARLPHLTSEELERPIQLRERTTTVAARLHWYYFHDTYHTGQTDLLRQVAGKGDRVI